MNDVDEYIANLQPKQATIIEHLRAVILASHPQMQESFKFKTPFYNYKSWFVYISILKRKRVYIGFIDGVLLSNQLGFLEHTTQTQIRHLYIDNVAEIEKKLVREHLQEAIIIRDLKALKKTRKMI